MTHGGVIKHFPEGTFVWDDLQGIVFCHDQEAGRTGEGEENKISIKVQRQIESKMRGNRCSQ